MIKGMDTEAGTAVGGARKVKEGRKVTMNAMELMMTRKIPTKTISKPIKNNKKGAKSTIRKGKVKTDSCQQGIE